MDMVVVPWPRTDGRVWGIMCPDHPTRGEQGPSDSTREGAEAYAMACACDHPSHRGVTLTSWDVPPFVGGIVRVGVYVNKFARARIAFFGDNVNAGLMEVGFLDGSTMLVPFEWCARWWPVPVECRAIPDFPNDPDMHLADPECEGHVDDDGALTSGAGVGEAVYCDGSCVRG